MTERHVVVVVTGHPATGKTTLARSIAAALRFPLVAKDAIKERLYDTIGTGDIEWSHRLGRAAMRLLYDQIESILEAGVSVVAEANFDADLASIELRDLINATGARVVQVVLRADPDVVLERFRNRMESGERHPGHPDDEAAALAELERIVRTPYREPELGGPVVSVDATDVDGIDTDDVIARVRHAIAQTHP